MAAACRESWAPAGSESGCSRYRADWPAAASTHRRSSPDRGSLPPSVFLCVWFASLGARSLGSVIATSIGLSSYARCVSLLTRSGLTTDIAGTAECRSRQSPHCSRSSQWLLLDGRASSNHSDLALSNRCGLKFPAILPMLPMSRKYGLELAPQKNGHLAENPQTD